MHFNQWSQLKCTNPDEKKPVQFNVHFEWCCHTLKATTEIATRFRLSDYFESNFSFSNIPISTTEISSPEALLSLIFLCLAKLNCDTIINLYDKNKRRFKKEKKGVQKASSILNKLLLKNISKKSYSNKRVYETSIENLWLIYIVQCRFVSNSQIVWHLNWYIGNS